MLRPHPAPSGALLDRMVPFEDEARACIAGRLGLPGLIQRCGALAHEFLRAVALPAAPGADVRPTLRSDLERRLNGLTLGLEQHLRLQATGRELPELCRLIALTCSNWVAEIDELSCRLAADSASIGERFGGGRVPRLVNVVSGLSDLHRHGRSVHLLEFEGFSLVYKPRSVKVEVLLHRFVKWFGQVLGEELRAVDMLDADGYSWCEYIAFKPFERAEDASRFFVRAGVLLLVCYLLGVTDCHLDNVSTTLDGPVLLDAETVLHPDFVPKLIPWQQPADTILRPGFVHSLRRLALDYSSCASLTHGFTRAYEALLRDSRLRDATMNRMEEFSECSSRVVFRATSFYHEVIANSLSFAAMCSRAERLRGLAAIADPFAHIEEARVLEPLIESERACMENLDVPYFSASTILAEVTDGHSFVAPVLDRAGLPAARGRLDSLAPSHLERMTTLLHGVLAFRSQQTKTGF